MPGVHVGITHNCCHDIEMDHDHVAQRQAQCSAAEHAELREHCLSVLISISSGIEQTRRLSVHHHHH